MSRRRRPLYALAFGAVAVPLFAASLAYACGALASLSVNPSSADAGSRVSGSGSNFTTAGTAEPVVVRFNSRTGPVLWSGRPDGTGAIEFAFEIPKVDPGSYVIIAMQNSADGVPAGGTPVRATLHVTGPPVEAVAPAAAPAEETTAPAAAPAAAPAPVAAPAPAATPRVRVAPANAPVRTVAPAPAVAAVPSPAAAAPQAPAAAVPAVAPAPAAPAPAVETAPAPARRSVMVSMSDGSDGSPALAIALVGVGLVLALGASALVLAGRRQEKAPARARR